MNRTTNSLTLIAMLLLGAPGATAQEPNTFSGEYGANWHVHANWSYAHWPTLTEDVLISDGKTCNITYNWPAATAALTLEVNGTLKVVGRTLTIHGADSSGDVDSVTVDGTLYLDPGTGGNGGTLRFLTPAGETMRPQLVGDVNGLVIGNGGVIDRAEGGASVVELGIGGSVTVKGDLEINKLNLDLAGARDKLFGPRVRRVPRTSLSRLVRAAH